MPTPLEQLARLDAAHRQQQAARAALIAVAVRRLWGDVSKEEIVAGRGGTITRWLDRSQAFVTTGHAQSVEIARSYYDVIRGLQAPGAKPFEAPIVTPTIEQIRTSLYVTGVVGAQKRFEKIPDAPVVARRSDAFLDPGVPLSTEGLRTLLDRQIETLGAGRDARIEEALATSGDAAAGAALRHTLNGGRDQVKESAKADARALGYVRVTSGTGTCYFCAMLASRGKVYKDDSFDASDPRFEGPGTAKVHDNCRCTLRPIYTRSEEEIPEFGRQMMDLWTDGDWPSESRGSVLADWRVVYDNWASTSTSS